MKADVAPVAAPFRSNRDALAFCCLLIFLLVLPLVPPIYGSLPARNIYSSMPAEFCDSNYLYRQIFETNAPADVVFVGSSRMWYGIDARTVEGRLRQACGNDKNVVMLTHNDVGLDADYFFLHDLLEHRPVRLVVIQMPFEWAVNWPHVLCETWFTMNNWNAVNALPFASKAAIYVQSVLGAPRKLLSLVGDETFGQVKNNCEETHGTNVRKLGYFERLSVPRLPFVPENVPAPKLAAEQVFYSTCPDKFQFSGEKLSPYQLYFIDKIMALSKEHGATVVCLHLPVIEEQTAPNISESRCWTKMFDSRPDMLAVPGAALWQGLSTEQVKHHFESDHHLNANGCVYFSQAISEGIIRAYQRATAAK